MNALKCMCQQAVSACTQTHADATASTEGSCVPDCACASTCDAHCAHAWASVHMHTCGTRGPESMVYTPCLVHVASVYTQHTLDLRQAQVACVAQARLKYVHIMKICVQVRPEPLPPGA